MPRSTTEILKTAEAALLQQEARIAAAQSRQFQAVAAQGSSGTGDMDAAYSLDVRFRLVFVRCHFAGTVAAGPMKVILDSARGSAYDALLFTLTQAGTGRDVHLRIPAEERGDPSPWTCQAGDQGRIQWTNPDPGNVTWGLEVGLAIAA